MFYSMMICVWFTSASATICNDGSSVGNDNFKKEHDFVDSNTGAMFLMLAPLYQYSCCGVVKQFKSYAMYDGDLYYMVWRPVDGQGKYRLVATFLSTLTDSPRPNSILPSSNAQAQVMEGDLYGWYLPGNASVGYITSDQADMTSQMLEVDIVPEVGAIVDWTVAERLEQRTYAVAAVVNSVTSGPDFKKMKALVYVQKDSPVGTPVYRIPLVDPHYQDTTVNVNPNQLFDVNEDRVLIVAGPLVPGPYELVITATDICYLVSSATITVMVTEEAVETTVSTVDQSSTVATDAPTILETDSSTGLEKDTTATAIPDATGSTQNTTSEKMVNDEDDGWKYGVGFSVAILALVAIGLVAFWMWKKKKNKQTTKPSSDEEKASADKLAKDGEPSAKPKI